VGAEKYMTVCKVTFSEFARHLNHFRTIFTHDINSFLSRFLLTPHRLLEYPHFLISQNLVNPILAWYATSATMICPKGHPY
jgi:hypothetical protein